MLSSSQQRWLLLFHLLLLAFLEKQTSGAFSFVQSSTRTIPLRTQWHPFQRNNVKYERRPRHSSSTALKMALFERMSEDCIGALVTSQKESNRMQFTEVSPQAVMVGIVDRPELARKSLKKYGITFYKVRRTFQQLHESDDNKGIQGLFQKQQQLMENDLPFSKELKQYLTKAGKLADFMASPTISSHHVLLALLGYNGETETAAETTDGLSLLLQSGTETFEAVDLCNDVIQSLLDQNDDDDDYGPVAAGGKGKTSSTPTLEECGVDLTQLARDGMLDPVYGREKEIQSCLRTLVRRRKNNPALIGEAGVGKTAIVEGLAQVLVDDMACPRRLLNHRIIGLEMATLVAGTKYRGEFEERLQAIVQEVTNDRAPPTILFLDEVHTLVGAGSAEGGMDAANMLKPALARGNLQVIGATTVAEYRKYIEKDAALERRLQPLLVQEPTVEETIDILQAIAPKYESHHGVKYSPSSLVAAAKLSERYVTDRFLPDKAIDLLDEAGAIGHMEKNSDNDDEALLVTEHTVAKVVSEWSAVPIGKLESDEMQHLMELEDSIRQHIKGQDRAVRSVARAVRRSRSGLRNVQRPVASFLMCGPTGVGKTELCKTLADIYFGSQKNMIRIDMSEYMEKHSVSRLTGPPPGYIGYEEGGQLTEAVRRAPHSLVLLDELEKAHGDVLNILLQIMEDGVLTDGKGRTVDFKNTILVMTSNVGSQRILQVSKKGKSRGTDDVGVNGDDNAVLPPDMRPEQVLSRLQSSPQAMQLMMEAASDAEILKAMQTAMTGLPADLLRVGRENPRVADFLQRLWAVLGAGESAKSSGGSNDLFRASTQATQGFVKGLVQQFQDMMDEDSSRKLQENNDQNDDVASRYSELSEVVKEELEAAMKPELLNRIDEIVVFSPLSRENLLAIAGLMVNDTVQRALVERNIKLDVSPNLIHKIMEEGSAHAAQFGARPMRRAAQRFLEDTVSDAVIRGFLEQDNQATVDLENDSAVKGEYSVRITKLSNKESLVVAVEDAHGGIGSVGSTSSMMRVTQDQQGLQTDPVRT